MKLTFDYPEQHDKVTAYVDGLVQNNTTYHVWHHGNKIIVTTGEDIEVDNND